MTKKIEEKKVPAQKKAAPKPVIVDSQEVQAIEQDVPELEEPEEVVVQEAPKKQAPVQKPVVNTQQRLVRIRTSEPVQAIIAQVKYDFPKDKEVSVPADVAAILTTSRKAYRI
jgi:hypothetical protein